MSDPKLQRLIRTRDRKREAHIFAEHFASMGVDLVSAARAAVEYNNAVRELDEYKQIVEERKSLFCGSKL